MYKNEAASGGAARVRGRTHQVFAMIILCCFTHTETESITCCVHVWPVSRRRVWYYISHELFIS